MKVQAIKTKRVQANEMHLMDLLARYITEFSEGSILAITSKVVSLCEGRAVPIGSVSKEQLIVEEAQKYAEPLGAYGFHFTITNNTLIPSAGIDESNGDEMYVLWPRNAQATASAVRKYLQERFAVRRVGVIITDSTCMPMRRGTSGICLAHSGFRAQHDYIGQPDLFGRLYAMSQSNIAGGLAASAVLVMGEGNEQTPLCVLDDVDFVQFQDEDPTPAELAQTYIAMDEDIFAPFLSAIPWKRGEKA